MRFMIIVKATPDTEAGLLPTDALIAPMAVYHEELAKAGVLLDANGLQPSSRGWRIRYRAGARSFVDGPFAEAKELIAGYTLIQVRSKEEAMEWARRFPSPHGELANGEIEVRQLFELDDFAPSESVERVSAGWKQQRNNTVVVPAIPSAIFTESICSKPFCLPSWWHWPCC